MTHSHATRRGFATCGCMFVLIAAQMFLSAWRSGEVRQYNRIIEHHVHSARDAGAPMSLDDLRAMAPEPHDGPHAGHAFERAFEELHQVDLDIYFHLPIVGVGDLPVRGEAWPEEWMEDAARYIEAKEPLLRLVSEAVRTKPRWHRPVPELQDSEDEPFAFGRFFSIGRIYQLAVEWMAQSGNHDGARDALLTLWALCDPFSEDSLPNLRVGKGLMLFKATAATESALARLTFTTDELVELQRAAERLDDHGVNFLRALEVWRALGHESLLAYGRGEYDEYFESVDEIALHSGCWLRASGRLQRVHAIYLVESERAIARAEQWLETGVLPADRRPRRASDGIFLWLVVPLHSLLAGEQQLLTSLSLSITSLAAARYEREHGRYPDALDDLVPEYLDSVPRDPFGAGEPLKYRRTETGAIIYSIGPNEIDHGGRERNDNNVRDGGHFDTDITFTLGDAQRELWPEQWPEAEDPEAAQ